MDRFAASRPFGLEERRHCTRIIQTTHPCEYSQEHASARTRSTTCWAPAAYLAHDTRLRRSVAIKLLPHDVANDADSISRIEQEACAASSLNHPNILTVHEIGTQDGTRFIATEFIEGESLRHRIRRGRLELREVLDIGVQAASALAAAHAAGIVHRDIKPENLMIRKDGIVKVLDFGLAKVVERRGSASDPEARTVAVMHTAPGVVRGTVNYMSPEQARGVGTDARTDVRSLGVVLYELLTGRSTFNGKTTSDVIAAILTSDPPPLAKYADDAPPELERRFEARQLPAPVGIGSQRHLRKDKEDAKRHRGA